MKLSEVLMHVTAIFTPFIGLPRYSDGIENRNCGGLMIFNTSDSFGGLKSRG